MGKEIEGAIEFDIKKMLKGSFFIGSERINSSDGDTIGTVKKISEDRYEENYYQRVKNTNFWLHSGNFGFNIQSYKRFYSVPEFSMGVKNEN